MTAKTSNSLVPKLRFPEFRNAGDWLFRPLSDIAKPISDRAGGTQCVPMSITTGVGLVSQEKKFGRTIAGDSYKNYIRLQTNDFAYNKSATKEFPQGYIARYSDTKDAAVPNSIFTCFRPDEAAVIPAYLDHLFYGNYHGRWLRKFITVGARAHGALSVSDDDLMAMLVPLPPDGVSRSEQQKIADCLSSLKDLIAAEVQKLEALRRHKKGIVQLIFPQESEAVPRLRFPEFRGAGEWQERNAGSLFENRVEKGEEGLPMYSVTMHDGMVRRDSFDRSFNDIEEAAGNKKAHKDDIAYNMMRMWQGALGVAPEDCLVSPAYIVLAPKKDTVSRFFEYLFKLPTSLRLLTSHSRGLTKDRLRLYYDDFARIPLRCPSEPEQQRIADCMCSLDSRIAGQARKLKVLSLHKQGLLQQLFPSQEEEASQ
jgi:type I restriction enzyme, S subunit